MYGLVATIAAQFDPNQWDPTTGSPDTATVTAMLEAASATLDGEIAHMVTVPVDPSDSPHLAAVCDSICNLRVQADIWDLVYPATGTRQMSDTRSWVWRQEATRLVTNLGRGAIADGVSVMDGEDYAGAPLGDTAAAPHATIGGLY